MARNLAHKIGLESDTQIRSNDINTRDKDLLNRRKLLQLGAIGSGAVLGAGVLSSDVSAGESDENTYTTTFEEYAQ